MIPLSAPDEQVLQGRCRDGKNAEAQLSDDVMERTKDIGFTRRFDLGLQHPAQCALERHVLLGLGTFPQQGTRPVIAVGLGDAVDDSDSRTGPERLGAGHETRAEPPLQILVRRGAVPSHTTKHPVRALQVSLNGQRDVSVLHRAGVVGRHWGCWNQHQ